MASQWRSWRQRDSSRQSNIAACFPSCSSKRTGILMGDAPVALSLFTAKNLRAAVTVISRGWTESENYASSIPKEVSRRPLRLVVNPNYIYASHCTDQRQTDTATIDNCIPTPSTSFTNLHCHTLLPTPPVKHRAMTAMLACHSARWISLCLAPCIRRDIHFPHHPPTPSKLRTSTMKTNYY